MGIGNLKLKVPEKEDIPQETPTVVKRIFDSESDGLALEATRIWCVVVKDYITKEKWSFRPGDDGWKEKLDEATHIIGHNIVEHDFPLMLKTDGWKPRDDQMIQDTLIMSRALDYKRFDERGHSMAVWAEAEGETKQEHEDWSQFSEEMLTRCESDVERNEYIYETVLAEYKKKSKTREFLADYLVCEHAASKWVGMAHMNGWPFDIPAAEKLAARLEEVVAKAQEQLQPKLGYKAVAVDKCKGEVEVKKAKWVQSGAYHHHTASWFGVDVWSGYEGEIRPIIGEYCRLSIEELKLSSTDDVKTFLFRNGWVPFEWNYKFNPETKRKEKTSPKITEDSLEFLGGDGKLYHEYSVASSRLSILKGWLAAVDENGDLHGDCVTIGTPSMRARHSVIVNVPSMDSVWGPEMRALFICKPGNKLVGCDSAGNQGRGLAHYLKNKEYTHILINEDIHMYNADKLNTVLKEMGFNWTEVLVKQGTIKQKHLDRFERFFRKRNDITLMDYLDDQLPGRKAKGLAKAIWKAKRGKAKRVYYAFLFGAGGPKLWGYCMGTPDEVNGQRLKTGFINAVPGFKALTDSLKNSFKKAKRDHGFKKGFILSIAGNRIYVDSEHKLLVYLLQAFEKATCSAAIMLLMQYLEEEGIPYTPHIFMHDEVDFSVPAEYAERAAELGVKAFTEGPKIFGVDIMSGSGVTGYNWAEIH